MGGSPYASGVLIFLAACSRISDRCSSIILPGPVRLYLTMCELRLGLSDFKLTILSVPPGNPDWGTYEDQLQDFEDFFCPAPGPDSVNWHPDHTIFMVFMGINDLAQLQRRDEGDIERCEKVARALFDNSSILHKLGARNFLFLNAHAYYRSPKFLLDQYFGVEQPRVINSVKYFNEAFALEVEAFRRRHPDANVMDFDLYRFVDLILDEPELFGLTETERFEMRWEGQPEEQESDNGEFGFA